MGNSLNSNIVKILIVVVVLCFMLILTIAVAIIFVIPKKKNGPQAGQVNF